MWRNIFIKLQQNSSFRSVLQFEGFSLKKRVSFKPLFLFVAVLFVSGFFLIQHNHHLQAQARTSGQSQLLSETKQQVIDRAYFYKNFRKYFHRELQQEQVNGYERMFNYWDENVKMVDLRWLAYALATAYHETGRKVKAIRECFCKTDACSIACVTKLHKRGRIKRNYAKVDSKTGRSYFGRGHVQLTHAYNYKRMGKELGLNQQLYFRPEMALNDARSTEIMFTGMLKGVYTGKKLSDYFNHRHANWGGARRIINGLDKSTLIAKYGRNFLTSLRYKNRSPETLDCMAPKAPFACVSKLQGELKDRKMALAGINNDLENLKTDIASLKKVNIDLLAENKQLKDALEDAKKNGDSGAVQVSDNQVNLQAENTRLTAEVEQLKENLTQLVAGLEDEGGPSAKISQLLADLSTQKEGLAKERASFATERSEFAKQQARLTVEKQELEQRIAQQEKQTPQQQEEIKKAKAELFAGQQELKEEREKFALAQTALIEKEKLLNKRAAFLEDMEQNLKERMEKHENEHEALLTSSTNLSKQSSLFDKQQLLLNQREDRLKLERSQLDQLKRDLEDQQAQLHEDKRLLEQEKAAFNTQKNQQTKGKSWYETLKGKIDNYWK